MKSSAMTPGVLFENLSIEEIQEVEKNTRHEIESKKEELRLMVGERYRDLIEAADTITEMKRNADKVLTSIARMKEMCTHKRTTSDLEYRRTLSDTIVPSTAAPSSDRDTIFYGVAAQMKVLMSIPEQIWNALETYSPLLACRLYLLARHTYHCIDKAASITIYEKHDFPVLARQWTTIAHFKTTIIQTCKDLMKNYETKEQVIADCLCAILLLENIGIEEAATYFIKLRVDYIKDQCCGPHLTSIRVLVLNICHIVRTTIMAMHVIFQPSTGNECLLHETLKAILEKGERGKIISGQQISVTMKYLPANITNFRPSFKTDGNPSSTDYISKESKIFISRSLEHVNKDLLAQLEYVTSLKSLAVIRDDLWKQLKEENTQWKTACLQCVGREIHIWESYLNKAFSDRIQEIIRDDFKRCTTDSLSDLDSSLGSHDSQPSDLSVYVWSCDNIKYCDDGTSLLKANAITPLLNKICVNFNKHMENMVSDMMSYLYTVDTEGITLSCNQIAPFDRFANKETIIAFAGKEAKQCIQNLLEHMKTILKELEISVQKCKVTARNALIQKILFLSRYSKSLLTLTPQLKELVSESVKNEYQPFRTLQRAGSSSTFLSSRASSSPASKLSTNQEAWKQVTIHLNTFNNDTFRVWCKLICTDLLLVYNNSLFKGKETVMLGNSILWDEINIEEEGEKGEKIESKINVPMQATTELHELLLSMCECVNKIAVHTLSRQNLDILIDCLCSGVLDVVEQVLTSSVYERDEELMQVLEEELEAEELFERKPAYKMSQESALQWTFDLKFLKKIITCKSKDDFVKRLEVICGDLETCIDPFDYDVFMPYIQCHLQRHAKQCYVLYGCLNTGDKNNFTVSSKAYKPAIEVHDTMLTVTSTHNALFTLLPISIKTRVPISTAESLAKNKTKSDKNSLIKEEHANTEGGFLSQMGSMWYQTLTASPSSSSLSSKQ